MTQQQKGSMLSQADLDDTGEFQPTDQYNKHDR